MLNFNAIPYVLFKNLHHLTFTQLFILFMTGCKTVCISVSNFMKSVKKVTLRSSDEQVSSKLFSASHLNKK